MPGPLRTYQVGLACLPLWLHGLCLENTEVCVPQLREGQNVHGTIVIR